MFYDPITAVSAFIIYIIFKNITVEEKEGLCYNIEYYNILKFSGVKLNEHIQSGKF